MNKSVIEQIKGLHVSSLFDLMKVKNFTKVREWVAENLASGVSDTEVMGQIYRGMKEWLQPKGLPTAVLILGEYQHKAVSVANQEINTVALCVEIIFLLVFD